MPPTADTDDLRRQLAHADAVIAELRGVVADLRKQVEAQQAHIHRLVKMTFGRGGERVKGRPCSTGSPRRKPTIRRRSSRPFPKYLPRRSGRATADAASRRTCRVARK